MIITIIRDFLDFSFRVVYIYDCVRFWTQCAVLAQSVARRLGKAEVGGSSPLDSFELFPGNARECGVSGVFLISADLRCRSSNLHRFQQKSHCRFSYRFTGLKKKCNSLLRILSLVMKYVILDLIEVVVQGDGFCIRGKPYVRKEL